MIFAAYGARTGIRSRTRYIVDKDGISESGLRRASVRWRGLREMRLDYYSTRRDRTKGWMQLKLTGEGAKIRIDSSLEGFAEIAALAAGAAAERRLELPAATRTNLSGLGISPDAGVTTGWDRCRIS